MQPDVIWERPNWSKEARLSSQVWFGMDAATRFILFRRWGYEPTIELEFTFMRKHQLTHFIDGATKLGLMDDPHPQLCAKYHCLSNLLGGIDMGYRDDGDRAWVFYMPPHFGGAGPLLPSPSIPALPVDIMTANFRAWHANNGPLLGTTGCGSSRPTWSSPAAIRCRLLGGGAAGARARRAAGHEAGRGARIARTPPALGAAAGRRPAATRRSASTMPNTASAGSPRSPCGATWKRR